jgi:hypothetical protein
MGHVTRKFTPTLGAGEDFEVLPVVPGTTRLEILVEELGKIVL